MSRKRVFLLLFTPIFLSDFALAVEWAPLKLTGNAMGLRVTGRVVAQEGATRIEPARVQGRITVILKREGETVETGTPLFEINSAECTSLIEERRVAETRKFQDLLEGTTRREKQLGLTIKGGACRIIASHSGIIVKRQMELGALFNVGDPLVTILDTSHLIVELEVPERGLSQVAIGQTVKFHLASDQKTTLESQVEHLLPTLDVATRTGKARLKPVKLPKRTTLEELVFGEILGPSEKELYAVPPSAMVFANNRQYLIKKNLPQPVAVPIEVVDESEGVAFIRPQTAGDLTTKDSIAVKGAILLFNEISGSHPAP